MKRLGFGMVMVLALMQLAGCKESLPKPPANEAIKIIDWPIKFGKKRIALTKEYIKKHYGLNVDDITIVPKIVVVHYTAIDSLKATHRVFYPEELGGRKDIAKASSLNVSAHFLVDKKGTIYRLMPENRMARHVIGLNYSAIGIENIAKDAKALTAAQVEANAKLVRYLKQKFPTITHLIGHHEYRLMEKTPLWLEKDKGYRTVKYDPGEVFMRKLRKRVSDLGLKAPK